MSERKAAIIRYIDGHRIEGGILIPTEKQKEIVLSGTKRFHNCLYMILGLNRLERALMDWLSEEMDDRNMVKNDRYVRDRFREFIKEIALDGKKKDYEDQSVANAFNGLRKAGLLVPHTRMYYQVNPEVYWRGSDKERIDSIMMNIQFESKESNFKVLNGSKYEIKVRNKK